MIQFKDFSASFGNRKVIQGLTCDFPRNSITSIIGASGKGKTTLLRVLCRMNDRIENFRIEGNIFIGGTDIYRSDIDVYALRRKVGMIFQKPCVFPISIYENAIFGIKNVTKISRKEYPDRAEKVLRDVFLWEEVKDRLGETATTLSQGQQQRLALARALAVGPEILLMDEPTSSLDPKSTAVIEELVHTLKDRHTIIWITHHHEQAQSIADRVLELTGEAMNSLRLAAPFMRQEPLTSFKNILQKVQSGSE
jgi:phosphate transport system ATP-binding protein